MKNPVIFRVRGNRPPQIGCLLIVFIMMTAVCGFITTSCNKTNKTHVEVNTNDSISHQQEIDSLASIMLTLDSINNSGKLVHYDIYNIGKLKGIEITVQKVSIDDTAISYINLRKDCGGEYFYSWEDAMIFPKELPSFYSVADTVKNNLGRHVNHMERFVYITKDFITLISSCESGNNWATRFSIDSRKSNSTITLSYTELDNLVELIRQAESKLKEIE